MNLDNDGLREGPASSSRAADLLERDKDRILGTWSEFARRQLDIPGHVSASTLIDSLPDFLGELIRALRTPNTARGARALELAKKHGSERSQLCEYDLRQVIAEYQLLRRVVLEFIRETREPSRAESEVILEVFDAAIRNAASEFQSQREARDLAHVSFRDLANALPQIVWTATADSYVDWYNDWWYAYLGLPRGTKWDDATTNPMHPDDVALTKVLWPATVAAGLPFNMEQRFRRGSDGQYRWHLVRGVPIRDTAGRVIKYVGANTDIHDHKCALQSLTDERQLRDKFVATLTHDLRTPLTAAKLAAQLLSRRAGADSKILNLAGRIAGSIGGADKMIEDLLDASRIRAGSGIVPHIEHVDVVDVARTTLAVLASIHGERFRLEGASRLMVYACPFGMRRAIENLASNAIKYGCPERPVTVRIEERAHTFSLSVVNYGEPISVDDKERLFEQFHRTRAAEMSGKRGWGIGLTIVKGVVESHGGKIEARPTPEGTVFDLELPLDARSVARSV